MRVSVNKQVAVYYCSWIAVLQESTQHGWEIVNRFASSDKQLTAHI